MDGPQDNKSAGTPDAGRRRGQMTSVAELVQTVTPNHGVDWTGLVGTLLGGLTVPLGVNDAGVLRIMAVNDTARREIEARADDLVSVWNTAARLQEAREASSLQCWVREGLKPPAASRDAAPLPSASRPVPEDLRADADAMTGPVDDASVRAALVDMRAKALAAQRARQQGDV